MWRLINLIAQESGSEISQVMDWIQTAGLLGLLTAIVYGVIRGWWVPGNQYRAAEAAHDKALEIARQERDEWRDIALTNLNLTTRTVSAAERISRATRE